MHRRHAYPLTSRTPQPSRKTRDVSRRVRVLPPGPRTRARPDCLNPSTSFFDVTLGDTERMARTCPVRAKRVLPVVLSPHWVGSARLLS